MKKTLVITLLLSLYLLALNAQNVSTTYWAGDASYNFHTFTGPDGNNAPDGWKLEYYVSVDATVNGLNTVTRLPLEDDLFATNQANNYNMDFLNGENYTGSIGQWYASSLLISYDPIGSPDEPVINHGDFFYIVLYNHSDPSLATHYCTSEMITAQSSGGPWEIGIQNWTDDSWIAFSNGNPNPATIDSPTDGAMNVPIDATLNWFAPVDGETPDGYKLYFGTSNPPAYIDDLGDVLTYDPSLSYSTTYYWQIVPYTVDRSGKENKSREVAKIANTRGDAAGCPIWSFTTEENPDPNAPTLLGPANGAEVPLNVTLTWENTTRVDPAGYKVYMKLHNVVEDFTEIYDGSNLSFQPHYNGYGLDFSTQYDWYVVAYTNDGRKEVVPSNKTRKSAQRKVNILRGDSAPSETRSFTTNDGNNQYGSGNNNGNGGDNVNIGIPPVNYGGSIINAGCIFDPSGTEEFSITVYVNATPHNPGIPVPAHVLLSYRVVFTGAGASVNVTLIFDQYFGDTPTEIVYWNGSDWALIQDGGATNIVYGAQHVSFDWSFTGARETTEFVINNGDSTLPVTLSSFDYAVTAENFVSINWETSSETNALGFNVYRSVEQIIPETSLNYGMIPATGASSQGAVYNYLDTNAQQKTTYYYWLESLDNDLTSNFFGPITVFFENEDGGQTPPAVPTETELLNSCPNPFGFSNTERNTSTSIKFNIAKEGMVQLDVFNLKGKIVKTLVNDVKQPGSYSIPWDGYNNSGERCASGVYFYRLRTDGYSKINKLMLLK
ncbi:MAG: FlgD immunoglobulin-like domain containing protein [Candidatus Cloacimonetes bacterium]|nr:FlgD immunoglobulin-like domain containing protein [Candidatus Cloacimonadota bacterium]